MQAYMFHSSDCDIEPYFMIILSFAVDLGRFIQTKLSLDFRDFKIQISKYEIPRTALFFTSSRFRDSSLRRRDFETRRKFAETHHFSRTILYPLHCILHMAKS